MLGIEDVAADRGHLGFSGIVDKYLGCLLVRWANFSFLAICAAVIGCGA